MKDRVFNYWRPQCCAMTVAVVLALGTSALADEIDDYVHEQMRQNDIPGLSLLVLRHGHVTKAAGYGLANIELKVPATRETVYEIGSVTKQFTASAVLLLAEEGKLQLDDKLTKYVQDLPHAWDTVTLRQLLTHTSGIRNYQEADGYSITTNYPFRELVQLSAGLPLTFPPGEKWAYSNTGYVLLGAVIESVSGRSYEAFLQDRFFIPLHMSNARLNDRHAVVLGRAGGYDRQDGRWINVPPQAIATSAGGVVSTVQDLAKWDAALNTDFPLKRFVRRQLWARAKDSGGNETPYGMGWFITSIGGRNVVEHSGATPGFKAAVCRFVDDETTGIVLTNSDNDTTEKIARWIAFTGGKTDQSPIQADAEALKATWLVVSAETGGRFMPEDDLKNARVSFTVEKVVLQKLVAGSGEGTYELRTSEKHKVIDLFIGANDDIRGIYELDGDRLKLCLSGNGKSRPTEFSGKGDQMLLVLRREK